MPAILPTVINGSLQPQANNNLPGEASPLVVGSPMWYKWLANNKSFRFESAVGSFTARKEHRPGGSYWYAYRRKKGKLFNTYLGSAEELSFDRLEAAAFSLNQDSNPLARSPDRSRQPVQISATSFLATKISVPPIRSHFVPRPRLVGLFYEIFSRKDVPHLTLLSAGAGYGKTTLLSEWASHYGGPVAWLSLDESDNDTVKFWSYLVAAVEQIWPGSGEMVQVLLQLPHTPPISTVLTEWLNAFENSHHLIVLVLDDFQFITSEAIYKDLTFLIEHLPPCLRLIISSRTDPPLPLALWRVRQQLIEIRADQLRFNYEEAVTFIQKTMDIKLAQTDIAALEERTEGWVAGLQLAALSLQGQPASPAAIAAFGRNHGPLLDYLAEEVLERQGEHVKDFLLRTAILERFNEELAQVVTGLESRVILAQLEKSNLFLIPLDRERDWYRYHHLFGAFLLNRLQRLQPQLLPELHSRASRWFEDEGMTGEAIQHALVAGLPQRAGQLIEKVALPMVLVGEIHNVRNWLDRLPSSVVEERPLLLLIYSWIFLLSGLLKESAVYIARAEAIIALGLEKAENATQLEAWKTALLVAQATLATRSEDVPATISLAAQVLQRLSLAESGLRSVMTLDLGNAYLINGEMQFGRQAFNQALATSRYEPNLLIHLIVVGRLGYLERECGRLQYAAQLHYQALAVVTERWGGKLGLRYPAICTLYTSLAALVYQWNRLTEARHLLEESLELNRYFASPEVTAGCYVLLSHISQAQGQPDQARRYLDQAEYLRQHHRLESKFAFIIRAWDIHLCLLQGQVVQARYLADTIGLNTQQDPFYRCQEEQIGLARLLKAEGRFGEAAEWLFRLERFALAGGHITNLLRIRLLQALLQAIQENLDTALELLQTIVVQSELEGFVRLFVDEGLPVKTLLQKLQQSGLVYPVNYVESLVAAFETTVIPTSQPQPLPGNDPAMTVQTPPARLPASVELSERERQVLQLLATGQSNTAIAGQLVISLATLKSHLHRIYRKLQVSNRRQALQAANKAGLLLNTPD